MMVFVAGMQRSGSTFAFNVARDVLRARGETYQEAQAQADLAGALRRAGAAGADHVLVKSHDADPLSLAMVRQCRIRTVCTVRRVEDAAASWLDAFGWSEPDTLDYLRRWLRMFAQARGHALVLPYGLLDLAPRRAAWRIARYLDPAVRAREVAAITARHAKAAVMAGTAGLRPDDPGVADIGFSCYDRQTFFHRGHVRSIRSRPAEASTSAAGAARIRAALAGDIAAAGLD